MKICEEFRNLFGCFLERNNVSSTNKNGDRPQNFCDNNLHTTKMQKQQHNQKIGFCKMMVVCKFLCSFFSLLLKKGFENCFSVNNS